MRLTYQTSYIFVNSVFLCCQGDRGDSVKGEPGEPGESGPQGLPGPPGPTVPSKTEKVDTGTLCKWHKFHSKSAIEIFRWIGSILAGDQASVRKCGRSGVRRWLKESGNFYPPLPNPPFLQPSAPESGNKSLVGSKIYPAMAFAIFFQSPFRVSYLLVTPKGLSFREDFES